MEKSHRQWMQTRQDDKEEEGAALLKAHKTSMILLMEGSLQSVVAQPTYLWRSLVDGVGGGVAREDNKTV